MKIKIRKATVRDFEQLRDLRRDFYLFESKKDKLCRKEYAYNGMPQSLARNLRSKKIAYFVAEKDKELVGYIGAQIEKMPAFKVPKKRVHLFNLYMKEDYRSKGIGKKLIAEGNKWARSKGIKLVMLYVYWWNTKARKLYNNLGFKDYVHMMVKPR